MRNDHYIGLNMCQSSWGFSSRADFENQVTMVGHPTLYFLLIYLKILEYKAVL